MNKKYSKVLSFSLLACAMTAMVACEANDNSSSLNTSTQDATSQVTSSSTSTSSQITSEPEVVKTIKKLVIATQPTKLEYEAGEAFSSEGLVVKLVETKQNEVISETETTDYTLSMEEGTILEEGEHEIIVKSNSSDVRSTFFNINVSVKVVIKSLHEAISELFTNNNFTVTNKIGNSTNITGLVNKDAIYWRSKPEDYFADSKFGYGTLDGKTYRFNIFNGQFKNAEYISELGGDSVDAGLWSSDTMDEFGSARISNYNLNVLTKEELDDELEYIKTVEPVEGNANRYKLDNNHVKWLFNTIGHTSLCFNPAFHLIKRGVDQGSVYLEVKAHSIHVDLVITSTYSVISGCSADITNIGTTVIPGKEEFLKNPIFGVTSTRLDLAQEGILEDDYSLVTPDDTKCAIYTKDYVHSKSFEDINGVNHTGIVIKENNNINKVPGLYSFTLNEETHEVTLLEKTTPDKLLYLKNFDLFKNLNKYFKQVGDDKNSYIYNLTDELEATSQLIDVVKLFTSYSDDMVIKSVTLSLVMAGPNLFSMKVGFVLETGELDGIDIQQFGEAKDSDIEKYIQSIYKEDQHE